MLPPFELFLFCDIFFKNLEVLWNMINPILSKTSFKRETVLAYALVTAVIEMEGNAQLSSMETNATCITTKNVLKVVQTYSQIEH